MEKNKLLEVENVAPGYRPKLQWDKGVQEYLCKAYGAKHFGEICQALTRPSIYSCIRVNTLQTTRREVIRKLDEVLESSCNSLNFVTKTCSTAAVASSPTDRSLISGLCSEHPLLPNVILVEGKGPFQVQYDTERGPMKEVIVSRKCAEAVLRGAHVFVPGVLACSGHVEKGDIIAVSVAVERPDGDGNWLVGVTRGTVLASEHAKSQFDDFTRRNWFIGKGRTMLSRASIFRERHGVAVEMVDRVYNLSPFHGLLQGEIFLQNLPSIVAAKVLDPKPGERILDMCAAPGGKTTAIAILMEDEGEVIAIDRSHNKVMDILKLAEEMKLKCISAYKLDALKSVKKDPDFDGEFPTYSNSHADQSGNTWDCLSDSENLRTPVSGFASSGHDASGCEQPEDTAILSGTSVCAEGDVLGRGQYKSHAETRKIARKMRNGPGRGQTLGDRVKLAKGFEPNSFDRVLLDAPCSALGLRPRLFAGEETLEGLRRHGNYQRRMFDQAVQLVRPGGVIVYSTCTINPGENEAVVRYALDSYNFLSLVPQYPNLGGPGLIGGLDAFDGMSQRQWLKDGEQHLVQRFDPAGPLDTIGFFIAKINVGSKDSG